MILRSYCNKNSLLFLFLFIFFIINVVNATPSESYFDQSPFLNTDNPSLEDLIKAGNKGDAYIQHILGFMYDSGNGAPQDYKKAIEWYTKAANQNHSESQAQLGYLYEKGLGIDKDGEKAVEWYSKAAEQGHPVAQYNLGLMYEKGQDVPQNYGKSIEWYTKSAEKGFSRAQQALGFIYEYGQNALNPRPENQQNVPRDDKPADEALINSALTGISEDSLVKAT
ncbi:MAG TPA: tetratricopeptide repeat protein, partial [Alphaproteobacteria bacterium]|nr:tetratricopeptide repeat protein [Alphaproteobacteria bacterium]